MPRQDVAALARENPDLLRPQTVVSQSGQHQFVRLLEQDLQGFRQNFTTAIRVANKRGVEIKVILGQLKRANVKPVFRYSDVGLALYRSCEIPGLEQI